MTSPFTPNDPTGRPTWTGVSNPTTVFTPQSGTGEEIITGGFGLGPFGAGGFGEGQGTSVFIETRTTWTNFTTR